MSLALLKRQMRFKAIAAINFTSTIAHILVSLSCAFAGFGFYSLIYASLVGTLVTVLGSNAIQRQFSTLGISFRYTKVIAQFGGYVSLSGVANQIAVALREVIIGKNISIESAAFFGKAVAITEILNKLVSGAIQKVIGPHIASLKRGGQDFLLFYKISTTLYASLVIPIYAFLALNANNLILLLFGDQWGAATALVPYVCLGLSLYSFSFAFEQTMLALGEAKYLSFFTVVLAILRVAVFLYASRFGLEVFAASLVIINLVRFSLISYFMRKSFGSHNFIDLADLIKILLTVLLVVASCLVVRSFAFQSAILELAVGGLFAVCVFIFAQLILKQKLYAEIRKTF
jgi:O-antigen/teichoic acid export membrane protein